MKSSPLTPRAWSWSAELAQTLQLHRQRSRRHWLSCLGIYYLEQNVQRGMIMKYLTNSVWSSWLSQRGWLPRETGKLKNSLLAIFPGHLGSQKQRSAEIKKQKSINNKERRETRREGERVGVGRLLLLNKAIFYHFIFKLITFYPLDLQSKSSQPFDNQHQVFFWFYFLNLRICQWILAKQRETDSLWPTKKHIKCFGGDGGVLASNSSVTRKLMWQEDLFPLTA